ncbi:hypothetical protein AAAB31_09720, partial [Lactobacillus acidophilus]|uniref:hypothetical protein n=1 Tax=Lactobacillus acidophilus TaxID=1579 RepID=UPI0030EFFC70
LLYIYNVVFFYFDEDNLHFLIFFYRLDFVQFFSIIHEIDHDLFFINLKLMLLSIFLVILEKDLLVYEIIRKLFYCLLACFT